MSCDSILYFIYIVLEVLDQTWYPTNFGKHLSLTDVSTPDNILAFFLAWPNSPILQTDIYVHDLELGCRVYAGINPSFTSLKKY